VRPELTAAGVITTTALDTTPEGTTVTVAGLAVVAQAPPTAKGVVFLSLEDEHGIASAILSRQVALLVTGVVQRRGPTTNVLVQTVTPYGAARSG
jgi:hypothetical protein